MKSRRLLHFPIGQIADSISDRYLAVEQEKVRAETKESELNSLISQNSAKLAPFSIKDSNITVDRDTYVRGAIAGTQYVISPTSANGYSTIDFRTLDMVEGAGYTTRLIETSVGNLRLDKKSNGVETAGGGALSLGTLRASERISIDRGDGTYLELIPVSKTIRNAGQESQIGSLNLYNLFNEIPQIHWSYFNYASSGMSIPPYVQSDKYFIFITFDGIYRCSGGTVTQVVDFNSAAVAQSTNGEGNQY